jgi:ankyrin repeat protein
MNCLRRIAYSISLSVSLCSLTAFGMDIFRAAEAGNLARVQELIDADRSVVNQGDEFGMTALGAAIQHGNQDIVQTLLAAGADPDKEDTRGWTPLYFAVSKGNKGIVQALLAAGADLNKVGDDILNLVPLHLAVSKGNQDIVQVLLAAGADLNKISAAGLTTLHWAIYSGNQGIAQALIAAGADLYARDEKKRTPFVMAIQYNRQDIVALFIAYAQRIEQARRRVHDIGNVLAAATHPRLGAESPLGRLDQSLLRSIVHMTIRAEEVGARQPQQRSWCLIL